MMRNCFKRYDKANSNIDFNSLSAAGGQGPNGQQPTGTGGMQPVQSPLIKSGTLKTQKSTTLNPSLQNTYILPATTQSRTLQYQQQQKLQLKSQGHLVTSNGGGVSSKSSTNLLQHQTTGNLAAASNGGSLTSPDHPHKQPTSLHGSLRPESGKKRTSFLMHSQMSQNTVGRGDNGQNHYTGAGSNTLQTKMPGNSSTQGGLSLNHQYNTELTYPKVGKNSSINHGHQVQPHGGSDHPGSVVTSPPKRGGQTRKPSGKSTKSNRAALTKKQLITHNQIFPGSSSGVSHPMGPTGAHTGSANVSQNNTLLQASQIKSPMLAKLNQMSSSNIGPVLGGGNNHGATRPGDESGKSNDASANSKQKSFSQPRLPSGKGANDGGTQSTYIISKNQIDFRKAGGIQARNGGAKDAHTPGGLSHYTGEGLQKPEMGVKSGLQNSNSVTMINTGGPVKTQNLIEHGAVAAVIPSQNANMTTSGASSSKNVQSSRSNNSASHQKFLPNIQPSGGATSHNQSQAMYAATTSISPYHSIEEVPNVPNTNSNSNTLHHLSNQTPASDYFNLKHAQSAKYGNSNGTGGSSAIRSTSQPHLQTVTGQKINQTLGFPGTTTGSTLQTSSSFVQPSSVVVPSGSGANMVSGGQPSSSSNVHSQMQNLLGKGLRSQSEPPQPQLKTSDSTASFMENLRQRATFSVVMRAAMLPKQPKRTGEKYGTEAQMASESVKATVTKLLQKNQPQSTLPFFQTSKVSSKAFGSVKAFAANTNVGIVRKANEDRISIILNVIQPAQKVPRIPADQWPKLQIFGVYDGHGGSKCAEYLKDNLHNNVILQPEFPSNIPEAIRKGSYRTEEDYLKVAAPSPDQPHNKAGSCAIVILVVNDDVYILNVGDSRAIGSVSEHPSDSFIQQKAVQAISSTESLGIQSTPQMQMEATSHVRQLSNDHKPSCPNEFKRICEAGGYVYQTQTVMKNGLPTTQTQQVRQDACPEPEDSDDEENPFVGPYRVFPGRLSVCRTFGDCEAKMSHLGGVQGVVTCDPEVTYEQEGVNSLDYVLIGSDGVFDKLKNDTINSIVWDVTTKQRQLAHSQGQTPSLHVISGLVADEVLHMSAKNRSLDNLSVVFVAFKRFKEYIEMQHQEYVGLQPAHPMGNLNQIVTPNDVSRKTTPHKANTSQRRAATDKSSNKMGTEQQQKTLQKNSNSIYKLESVSNVQQPYSNNSNVNSMANSHKTNALQSSLLGAQNSQDVAGTGNNTVTEISKQSRGQSANGPTDGGSVKTQSNNNQFYLNKMREQHAAHQQRHTGMLENINRPSSRQGASRKGMRSRKANNNALAPNAQSYSQDSRPTLPHVQSTKPSTGVGANSSSNAQSKQAYNQLSDVVKQSTNSASAANLPSAHTINGNSSVNISGSAGGITNNNGNGVANGNTNGSQSTSNVLSSANNNVGNPVFQSSRDQISSAHQANRRGGLFKVNTNTGGGGSGQPGVNSGAASGGNAGSLPNFMHPGGSASGHKSQNHINTSTNNSTIGLSNSGKAATDQQRMSGVGSIGVNKRQKMKPYKSNQIRRMPDNSANVPMKFITEPGQAAKGAGNRDASQGAISDNPNASASKHKF